jgi:hypothetical protein
MPAPQEIVTLLDEVEASRVEVDRLTSDKSSKDAALVAADSQALQAGRDLETGKAHLKADLDALIAKLQTTYGGNA